MHYYLEVDCKGKNLVVLEIAHMHHASSDVIGSQGVESQSHHLMHDVYLQFPVYFTTICLSICQLQRYQELTEFYDVNFIGPSYSKYPKQNIWPIVLVTQ